ncbi:MAG TPA: endo-1,4-beta-xylanase [Sphingobacteriaceae bacterium]
MKIQTLTAILVIAGSTLLNAQTQPTVQEWNFELVKDVMSPAYWKIWNKDVQDKIDKDIEKNRKANASLNIAGLAPDGQVQIEQLTHDFIFGANIFNFNQLGTHERNRRYRDAFGTLFNSASVPFYWKKFEMEPNRPRFREEYWDTEEFWNTVADPKSQPHWRRPSTDAIVEYGESRGIRLHGHTLTWGHSRWQHPEWLVEKFAPQAEKERLSKYTREDLKKLTNKQVAEIAPEYSKLLKGIYEKHIEEIASHYGGRLSSWDVVNESSQDYFGNAVSGDPVTNSTYGVLMPGDYTFHSFKKAEQVFPKDVKLNINDWKLNQNYVDQINALIARGARIDIIGLQNHMFDPQRGEEIAAGKEFETPKMVRAKIGLFEKLNRPIHISEVTITAPSDDTRGRAIQAMVAYNLYRLWFSLDKMMGITWWNLVDDCGAPGEPTSSGIFTRNMTPKTAYYALNDLINNQWKTNLTVKTDGSKPVSFRGFKGKYRVTWKDKSGASQEAIFELKKDGDGF